MVLFSPLILLAKLFIGQILLLQKIKQEENMQIRICSGRNWRVGYSKFPDP
jgi:hypothetical protein